MKFTGKDGQLRIYEREGGYVEVHFSNMDFTSTIGRPKVDEMLVLDRGLVNSYGHYIKGNDQIIFDPTALSFSCMIDDVTHINTTNVWREVIYQALVCQDGRNEQSDDTWPNWGASTKAQYQNKAGVYNPPFAIPTGPAISTHEILSIGQTGTTTTFSIDTPFTVENRYANFIARIDAPGISGDLLIWGSVDDGDTGIVIADPTLPDDIDGYDMTIYPNYKTVDMEYKLTGEAADIAWAFREVYFPPNEIVFSETEESLILTATGGVYGPVERGTDWIAPNNTIHL